VDEPSRPRQRYVRRRGDVVGVVLGPVVFFVGTSMLGRVDRLPDWEGSVFRWINGLPDGLRVFKVPVMQAGTVLAIAGVALLLIALRRRRAAAVVVAAGYGAYFVARGAKLFVGRARPGDLLGEIVLRDTVSGLGFPSGHSAASMAVVLAVIPYVSWRWRWALLAVPLIVGFARVYVGAHLPLDVLGGWAIGVTVACAVHLIFGVPRDEAEERSDARVR